MLKKFGYSLIVVGALMFSIGAVNTFAAHDKCPKDCKCPQDVKCKKECEEGKTKTCTCKH